MTASETPVLVSRDGAIATITFNRPDRRNGVTVELCTALYDATREVAASDARVVVLRGAGDHFCVGADLTGSSAKGTPYTLEDLGLIHHSATLLHTMPQVTIAAIDGGCAGAGMGWAAACDLRFASDAVRFNTAFLAVGVPGDMGLAWSLNRVLGGARARELLLMPERFGADDALAIGLVSKIFPQADLHDQVGAIARQMAAREPFALRMMKANILSAESLSLAEFIDVETARQVAATSRPDIAERMAAAFRQAKG